MSSADWLHKFGPEYPKINTAFERDGRGVVEPDRYALPEIEYLADNLWTWHEKIDGMNMRLHWNGSVVTIGGREDNALLPARVCAHLAQDGYLDPSMWTAAFPGCNDVTVYGEGYGAGIRSGGNYDENQRFIVFDVNVGGWWLERPNVEDVASKLGLQVVPCVGEYTVPEMWDMVKLEDSTSGVKLSSAWPGCPIEGAVGRPAAELFTRKGERLMVKLKTRDYKDWLKREEKIRADKSA